MKLSKTVLKLRQEIREAEQTGVSPAFIVKLIKQELDRLLTEAEREENLNKTGLA